MMQDSGLEGSGSAGASCGWSVFGSCSQLLDLVSDGVFVFDASLRIVRTNAAFNARFGGGDAELVAERTFGNVVGCRNAATGGCGGDAACRLCGLYVAADTARLGSARVHECRILTDSGDAYDFAVHASPAVIDGYGLCALRDLHAHKRLRVLERCFFHDVINLAVGVKGLTEMFDVSDTEQTEEYVRLIHDSAEKMVDEILRLRTLRGAECGDLTTCCANVSACETLQAIIAHYREEASSRHLDVVIENQDDTIFETDRELVQMVLGSLVLNAIEASSRGNRVSVGYVLEEASIVFHVRNEQVMDEDVRLQVFERSFSTKGAGKGVGAYGVKLITERYLGGQVWFESGAVQGTVFYVRMPFAVRS